MSSSPYLLSDPRQYPNIPAALTTIPNWVNWRAEERLGKMTKVPYCANTGRRASSTDPNTWTTFERAVDFQATHKLVDGIGFVVTLGEGIVGIDLDHVVNLQTREIDEWAVNVLHWFPSYTEVSPSGTGLRIFVRGTLPAGGRKKGPFEFYAEGRYLTVTGDMLIGSPPDVREHTAALAQVHLDVFGAPPPAVVPRTGPTLLSPGDDHDLLERAMNAANGASFRALWFGDISGYPSHSEADLALCDHLVFWCGGDTAWADRLFRQSGLFREEWDVRHAGDGRTLGQLAWDKALAGATAFYESRDVRSLPERISPTFMMEEAEERAVEKFFNGW